MRREESKSEGPFSTRLPSNDHLLAIGKLVVTFSGFEEMVAATMALCYGCEPEAIANIAYALDISKRCQMLRGILAYRLGSRDKSDAGLSLKRDKDMKKIARLFKQVTDAIERRNFIVHSSWLTDDETGEVQMANPKGRQNAGFPGGDISPVSVDKINSDTEFISKVSDDLWKYFWDNLGSWVLQRANRGDSGIYLVQSETNDKAQINGDH